MRLRRLRVPALGVLSLLVLTLSACGGSGHKTATTSPSAGAKFAPVTAPPAGAKRGGQLKVLAAGDVDYIDPGAAHYQFTFMIDGATERQLLSWRPGDVERPRPDLAAAAPEISGDGLTITFHIKPGVKFSPPVDRAVKCDDFKYAIERALLPAVGNGYVGGYLKDVAGFKAAQAAVKHDTKVAPSIAGLQCPDDATFVIKLAKPSSASVLGPLSLPLGAPVPREYAGKYDAVTPSAYGSHVVGTGPYMIANDASGKLTGYTSGKLIKLARNPNWSASTDWRPAYLDGIEIQEGFADTNSATQKILAGRGQVNGDLNLDATSLKLAATRYPQQLSLTPAGSISYIALNTAKAPFDDINVRKAVIAASNRTDLRATRGGSLVGGVASHFLPPGIPGFDEAGGTAGPELDFVRNANGDMAVATKYMKAAGFTSGKCQGACNVTMVGDGTPPGSNTAEVFKNQLEQLGFHVSFQKVAHDVMYTKFCMVPKAEPSVCPNVGWLKDFQDPQSILELAFGGEAINPSNNPNFPQLNDPAINRKISDAVYVSDPSARARAWGDVDRQIMAQAAAVPWLWANQGNVRSRDVAGVINRFSAKWDLSFTSIR